MWCHLTFRCQSNWLTGKKINSERPVPAKASEGRLPAALGRAGSGPPWANGMRRGGGRADKQAPCQLIPALRKVGRGNQPPPGASLSLPHHPTRGFGTHGSLGPTEGGREQTPTPLREGCSVQNLGRRWGSPTLTEVLTSRWFFSAPVQYKERRDLKGKSFLSWPLGKKQN